MKKIMVLFILLFFTPIFAFAAEIVNVDLKKDTCYLLLLNDEAVGFNISNPNIMSFQLINTLIDDKQEVILQTLNLGSTIVEVKTKTSSYKYKFNVLEKANTFCENLFEIEKPKEGEKN